MRLCDSAGRVRSATVRQVMAASAAAPSSTYSSSSSSVLDATVASFQARPALPNTHPTAAALYDAFCRRRTAALHAHFFRAVGDDVQR